MAAPKTGRQTPTTSVVASYRKTKGKDAIALYNKTGSKLYPWQASLLKDILAYGKGGKWIHSKYGYSVSRRNGKSETVIARILYALQQGEKVIYTAHRTSTSHAVWERICDLLPKAGFREKEDFSTLKQFGFETIKMRSSGAVVNFRTRSSKGGLGEGYDLLIIDEAQEYTEDQSSALKYLVSASNNPQTIYLGTPPTPQSSGTVFTKYRETVLANGSANGGWAEWAVSSMSDPQDRSLWYEVNPSMGYKLTERAVADEYEGNDVDFNIQRLGLWLSYNLKSAISQKEWEALKCTSRPEKGDPLFAGVKFGVDGRNVALSVAFRTEDKIFVEALDCQPVKLGFDWILDYLKRLNAKMVVVDGKSGQGLLAEQMKAQKLKGLKLPAVAEVVVANSVFEQAVFAGTICHMNQPSLTQSVSNCEKRSIGSSGGFGYKSLKEDIEIALMDSAILAHWACHEYKAKRKQRIRY